MVESSQQLQDLSKLRLALGPITFSCNNSQKESVSLYLSLKWENMASTHKYTIFFERFTCKIYTCEGPSKYNGNDGQNDFALTLSAESFGLISSQL